VAASCGTCSVHCGNTKGVLSTFPVVVSTVFQVYTVRLQPLNRGQHHHQCPHLLGTATLVPLVVHCLAIGTHVPGQPCPSSVLQKTSNVSIKFTKKPRVHTFTYKNSSQNQHKTFNFMKTLFKKLTIIVIVGRDSSVGLATRYGLDGPGIESRWPPA
jgi:hypothetical protein